MSKSKYFIQTPHIIPLREPRIFDSKTVNDKTKIELSCDTGILDVDIFYTIDGSKPEPYVPIVQGGKTFKYDGPFLLPPGKITVKAVAVQKEYHNLQSSVITKVFNVVKSKRSAKSSVRASKSLDEHICENICEEDVEHKSTLVMEQSYESEEPDSRSSVTESFIVQTLPFESDSEVILNRTFDIDDEEICSQENSLTETHNENASSIEKSEIDKESVSEKTVFCIACGQLNATIPHCSNCGQKLHSMCFECAKVNFSVAHYCESCGISIKDEMNSEFEIVNPVLKSQVDAETMVKPFVMEQSTNSESVEMNSIQTSPIHFQEYAVKSQSKRSRSFSPGGGFWRTQTDFICTELKTHAMNNRVFQHQIGNPPIRQLQSAEARVEDNMFIVEAKFSIYVP